MPRCRAKKKNCAPPRTVEPLLFRIQPRRQHRAVVDNDIQIQILNLFDIAHPSLPHYKPHRFSVNEATSIYHCTVAEKGIALIKCSFVWVLVTCWQRPYPENTRHLRVRVTHAWWSIFRYQIHLGNPCSILRGQVAMISFGHISPVQIVSHSRKSGVDCRDPGSHQSHLIAQS